MTFFSHRPRAVVGISVLAVAIVVGGTATAALAVSTAWSTLPANLSVASQSADDPQVTVDGSGLATAVWSRYDGSNNIVQASTSLNGAPWSTPADLSATGQHAFEPQVTVDGSGLATAVWYRHSGINNIVQASTSLNGAPWSTPADLSATGQTAYAPQVTVDGSGLATAVWVRSDGFNDIVQASSSLNGAAWSILPANLSAAGQNADEPQVTVDGSGFATAVWYRGDGSNTIVQASFFDSPVPITPAALAATGVDTATVALTSTFALLVMFAGIGMTRIRRRQATPSMVTSSQQRQQGRNH